MPTDDEIQRQKRKDEGKRKYWDRIYSSPEMQEFLKAKKQEEAAEAAEFEARAKAAVEPYVDADDLPAAAGAVAEAMRWAQSKVED